MHSKYQFLELSLYFPHTYTCFYLQMRPLWENWSVLLLFYCNILELSSKCHPRNHHLNFFLLSFNLIYSWKVHFYSWPTKITAPLLNENFSASDKKRYFRSRPCAIKDILQPEVCLLISIATLLALFICFSHSRSPHCSQNEDWLRQRTHRSPRIDRTWLPRGKYQNAAASKCLTNVLKLRQWAVRATLPSFLNHQPRESCTRKLGPYKCLSYWPTWNACRCPLPCAIKNKALCACMIPQMHSVPSLCAESLIKHTEKNGTLF